MAKAAKIALLSLATIVAATRSETGFLFASKAAVAPLIEAGTVEMNEGVVNPDNALEFAVRATPEGLNTMTDTTNAPATPAATPAKRVFTIETIDAPERKKRGNSGVTLYPFDELPAPTAEGKQAAFFVASEPSRPEPWKSLQSAVSAATRRYATKTGDRAFTKADGSTGTRATYAYTRKFVISEGEREGVKGAWVSRSE